MTVKINPSTVSGNFNINLICGNESVNLYKISPAESAFTVNQEQTLEHTIIFKLIRGSATLSFDNNPDIFKIDEGSELQFKLSDKTTKIYELESLRCLNCQIMRG